jgi:hypothetical protein
MVVEFIGIEKRETERCHGSHNDNERFMGRYLFLLWLTIREPLA